MSALLSVRHLSVYFQNDDSQEKFLAVDDVSFILEEGEVLGIVGESGSGKSVTALSIPTLLPSKASYSKQSSIKINGKSCIGANEVFLRKIRGGEIGFIFQEPMSSLNPLHTIGKQIMETMLIHQKISYKTARKKSLELLKKVGIENAKCRFDSYPFELSGGQRQRVMIAMAIANAPKILIADEPTTALDVTVQEQIIKLLIQLKKDLNIAIIFISHDLLLVHRIADRILVMNGGKIVESGSAQHIFNTPRHEYTKKLVNATMPTRQDIYKPKNIVMKAENISVEFPLKKNFWGRVISSIKAVDNVSLKLYKGQTLGLVGESGSGKTTLAHCLVGLCKHSGTINLKDTCTLQEFHRKVQIVFQDPYNSLNPRLNILQILSEGLRVHFPNLNKEQQKIKVIDMLKETGLSENDIYKYPHEFSGGQRQRIAIARALIINPEIVILDEPTSALDITIQIQIISLLKKLQQKFQTAYLFISHDMRTIQSISDTIAVMKNGKIVEEGTTETIFCNPQNSYVKSLIAASMIK